MIRPVVSLLLASCAAFVVAVPAQQVVDDGTVRVSESWEYKNCGNPTDALQIESIVVTPDPPKPGEKMTVEVKATALETIEDGAYADVTVKMGLIKLLHKEFDLCEEAEKANATVTCPVEKGVYTVVQEVDLPKEIPPAKFNVDVLAYTADDDDLACLKLSINFMKSRSIFDFL